MHEIEVKYISEYKRLDCLCKDMLSTSQGISEYISRMELFYKEGILMINDWESDYYLLKHLRWLRNKIVHTLEDTECNIEEVKNLSEFYQKVLRQEDPLAKLYKTKQINNVKHNQEKVVVNKNNYQNSCKKDNTIIKIIMFAVSAILITMVWIILFF